MDKYKKITGKFYLILSFFILSFSNTIFFICIFKILLFNIQLTPIILALLTCCFPIGGLIASIYFTESKESFLRSISIIKIAIFISCFSFTVCLKIIDPFAAFINKGYISIFLLLFLLIAELILFCPYFIAWGISEYCGYKLAVTYLKRKEYFYIIFILGALSAYSFTHFTFPLIGFVKTILLSFLGLIFIEFIMNVDESYFPKKGLFKIVFIIILYFLFTFSNLENKIIIFIQNNGPFTAKSILDGKFNVKHFTGDFKKEYISDNEALFKNTEILLQKWTKYCHLTLIKSGRYLYGLYNGRVQWVYINYLTSPTPIQYSFESLPFMLLPENSSIAIVGAGGGMQVKNSLFFKPKEVVAIELIPEIFNVLKNDCPESNECIYLRKDVKCIAMEGRKYFETSNQEYDLIYSANTEGEFGLFRIFFDPSQLFHTMESFKAIKKNLKSGGMIAIKKEGLVYRGNELFDRYFVNLQKAGFITLGYFRKKTSLHDGSFILLGYKDYIPTSLQYKREKIEDSLRASGITIIKEKDIKQLSYLNPIIDNEPFSAGILFNFIRRSSLIGLTVILFIVFIFIYIFLKKYSQMKISEGIENYTNRGYLILLSVLVGCNFVMIENSLIYKLAYVLKNPLDAFWIGTISFLFLISLGSMVINRKTEKFIFLWSIVSVFAFFIIYFSDRLFFTIMVPIVMSTGIFFPKIFLMFRKNTALIFLFDGIGAFLGSILSLSLPLFMGFNFFYGMSIIIFLLCSILILFLYSKIKHINYDF